MVAAVTPALQLFIQPIIEGDGRLGVESFSQLAIGESVSTLFFVFILFSFNASLSRHFYDNNESKADLNKLISTCFSSILYRGIIVLGLCLLFGDLIGSIFKQEALKDFYSYGLWAVLIAFTRSINVTAASLFRNEKSLKNFVLTSLAFSLFRVAGILIALFYYDMSFLGYMVGNACGGGIVTISVLVYMYVRAGIKFSLKMDYSLRKFSTPLFFSNLANWGLLFIDRYFLEITEKTVDLGIYDQALKFALGIELILAGINGVNQPEMFRLFKDPGKESSAGIKRLGSLFIVQTSVIICLSILPIMFFLNEFMETELAFAANFITIILFQYFIKVQGYMYSYPLLFAKKTKIFLFANVISLSLNIGLNFILIPKYGIYGAIIATFLSRFLWMMILRTYQRKHIPVHHNEKKIFYFPMIFIALAILVEVCKNVWSIDGYLPAIVLIFMVAFANLLLYKKMVMSFVKKYLGKI